MVFRTDCQLKSGTVDKIIIKLKYPHSDFQQKVLFKDSTPDPSKKEFISRGSHDLYTYELEPTTEEMEIITRFEIQITGKKAPISRSPFPIILEKQNLKYYVQPTPLVESDAIEIQELAENLTALSKFLINSVSRIIRWITKYLRPDESFLEKRQSALGTFHSKKGTCEDINHLFNAICRAVNIPARIAMGVSKSAAGWGRHVWSEVYDPQFGWFPVDVLYRPTQVSHIETSHLKRMTALDCSEPEFRVEYEYDVNDSIPILSVTHSLFIDRSIIPATVEINPTNNK